MSVYLFQKENNNQSCPLDRQPTATPMLALSRRLSEGTFDDATSAASIATAVDELLALDPSNERDATSALALFAAYNVALERPRTTAVANEKNSVAAVALLASVLGALRTAILARCPFGAELSSAAAAVATHPVKPLASVSALSTA